MLAKSIERLTVKLKQKKQRYLHQLFVAEGEKTISDLLASGLVPQHIFSNDHRFAKHENYQQLTDIEFKRISQLDTADGTLAIFPFPRFEEQSKNGLCLVLDNLKIPGNLGTIIRTADWFGVCKIYCTTGTTDVYNAKAVQSTMGSLGHVAVEYATADEILEKLKNHQLLVADMEGLPPERIVRDTSKPIALIMGSESHGPSPLFKKVATAISISRKGNSKAESLNVAIATAILLHQFS